MSVDFYNENVNRAYPFITTDETGGVQPLLPEFAVADFGAIMGPDAGYNDELHLVYLKSISRSGTTITFDFRTTAAPTHALKFQREISDAKFSTEFAEAVLESSASSSAESSNSGDCPTQPLWEGFLVTGNMAAIAAAIADGETIEFDVALWQVEPSLVQNLRETFVRTVNLANHDRLHVTPGESCSSQSSLSSDEIFVDTRCLTGDLRLREGFNCSIRQENATRTLTIGAAVGAGSGLPCEEIPLYAGEDAPGGDPVLSGGPDCLSVLKTINGVGGTILQLTPGDGVRIFPHETSPNKLVVDVDLHDFAICALPDEGESSLSI